MPLAGEVLIGLGMAVGLVGVIVPVIPGLVLIGGLGLLWAYAEGGATAWSVAVAMVAILAVGTYLKYRLPGRELQAQGIPQSTWLLVGIGGVVGFFVVPVVGMFAGVLIGAYVGERVRFRRHAPAWQSTKRLLVGIGKGMAVELAAGTLAVLVWLAAVIAI